LPPEQRRARTLAALIAQVEALARQCPVLMIFEDAHWSDPTSLEALGRTIDRIANLSRPARHDVSGGIRAGPGSGSRRSRC
jgi:predicted ATPase